MSVTTPPVITAPSKRRRIPHAPKTEQGLWDALAYLGPQPRRVTLRATIRPSAPLFIPPHVELVPGIYGFEGDQKHPIIFEGVLNADRVPVFYGYEPGQIVGTFGGKDKLPEHWWSETEDEAPAINCAIQSKPVEFGHVVSLAARRYFIGSDLPMAETYTALVGAGGSRTLLHCLPGWTPKRWHHANQWAEHPDGNHAFVIGMGGKVGNSNCYHSVVEGISINCYHASATYKGTGRKISAISSEGPVQENSRIHDVSAAYATGCAIGFPRHGGIVSSLNGLDITSVWLHTMGYDSVPLLFTPQSMNTRVQVFTVDCGIEQPEPEFRYPRVAAQLMGTITMERGHFERVNTAIRIAQGEGTNDIVVSNVDFNNLNDRDGPFNSRYEPATGRYERPDQETPYYQHSCGVLLDSAVETIDFEARYAREYNLRDRVRVEGLYSCGQTTFLLRDRATGVNLDSYGQGQHPHAPAGGLRHYSRRDLWTPQGWYDARHPAGEREYFTLKV